MKLQEGLAVSKVAAIVGISKNAGKTSLLNYILAQNPRPIYGVMSTGIDGEDFDIVFKHPKPKVALIAGSLFISDREGIEALSGAIEILSVAPGSQPNRKIWIARAERDIQARITGPSSVNMQIEAVKLMQKLGAEILLIDGALDRKSIVTSDKIDEVYLVAGASFGTLDKIETELRRIKILSGIAKQENLSHATYQMLLDSHTIMISQEDSWVDTGLHSLIGSMTKLAETLSRVSQATSLYVPGALTESLLKKLESILQKNQVRLLLRHSDNLKLSYDSLQGFIDRSVINCLIPFRIKLVAINSWAPGLHQIDADDFRKKISALFDGIDCLDIMEAK